MRNIIRAKIIPELERINPSFVEAGLRTAARVKESEDFIEYCIDQLNLVEKREGVIYIDKSKLSVLPGKETVLYQLIRPYGFSYDQVNSIAEALSNTGAVFYSKEWFLNIDREQIILQKKILEEVDLQIRKGENLIELPIGNLAVVITDAQKYKIQADPKIAAIDFDKLVFPLHLRVWQKGDYIIPLGMTGRKKVSDLLIDNKISMAIKQNLLVLVSNAEIVWVVGERISDRFKITRQTAKVFEIIWRQNH